MTRHSYSIVSGPANEPVTYEEVKSWAKIDTDDDRAIVEQLITASRMACEEYLRRSLITQTLKLTLDLSQNGLYNALGDGTYQMPASALYGALPPTIELPKGPLQSITSITTYGIDNTSAVFSSSNYLVDTAGSRVSLNYGQIWPANMRVRGGAEIIYVAGYGDNQTSVPQPIKTGIMIHVASLYEQRGQSADSMEIPPGALMLYNKYRIVGNRI